MPIRISTKSQLMWYGQGRRPVAVRLVLRSLHLKIGRWRFDPPLATPPSPSCTSITSTGSPTPDVIRRWVLLPCAMTDTVKRPVRTVVERGPKGKRSVAFGVAGRGGAGARRPSSSRWRRWSATGRWRSSPGCLLRAYLDRAGSDGRGGARAWDHPAASVLGVFDGVAARVSPEMRKGPRGGGRDRDQIIRHTVRTESEDFARRIGLRIPESAALSPDGLRRHRQTYAAMRAYNAGEASECGRGRWRSSSGTPPSTRWTHAWELEDKDLSAEGTPP